MSIDATFCEPCRLNATRDRSIVTPTGSSRAAPEVWDPEDTEEIAMSDTRNDRSATFATRPKIIALRVSSGPTCARVVSVACQHTHVRAQLFYVDAAVSAVDGIVQGVIPERVEEAARLCDGVDVSS
jgi:hypothetical protein